MNYFLYSTIFYVTHLGFVFDYFILLSVTCRSVIVAGGTMQPLWEFQYQLFGAAGASQDRVMTFACGHVIPPDHVLPIALCRGPSNKPLDFSWGNRSSMLDELSNLILNIIQVQINSFIYIRIILSLNDNSYSLKETLLNQTGLSNYFPVRLNQIFVIQTSIIC